MRWKRIVWGGWISGLCGLAMLLSGCGLPPVTPLDTTVRIHREDGLPFMPAPHLMLSDADVAGATDDMLNLFIRDLHLAFCHYFAPHPHVGPDRLINTTPLRVQVVEARAQRQDHNSPSIEFFGHVHTAINVNYCRPNICREAVEEHDFYISQRCTPRGGGDPVFDCHAKVGLYHDNPRLPIAVPAPHDLALNLGQRRGNSPKVEPVSSSDWMICNNNQQSWRAGCRVDGQTRVQTSFAGTISRKAFREVVARWRSIAPWVSFQHDTAAYNACWGGAAELQPLIVKANGISIGSLAAGSAAEHAYELSPDAYDLITNKDFVSIATTLTFEDPTPYQGFQVRLLSNCALVTSTPQVAFPLGAIHDALTSLAREASAHRDTALLLAVVKLSDNARQKPGLALARAAQARLTHVSQALNAVQQVATILVFLGQIDIKSAENAWIAAIFSPLHHTDSASGSH